MISRFTLPSLIAASLIIGIALTAGSLWTTRSVAPPNPDSPIVATVGMHSITQKDVEQAVALSLYQMDQQRHVLMQRTLRRLIDDTLLSAEATSKGVTVSQLLEEAAQSAAIARLADLPGPVKRMKAGENPDGLHNTLTEDPELEARIRQALLVSLHRQTNVRILLQDPALPILQVSVDDDPSIGPANAPVTIVEFSDFQCPYCKKSVSDVKELLRIYGQNIRLVYRDYPGPNHPHAMPAAEAAQCAAEQGRFWEYHDVLFERQTAGKGWDFLQLAKELGLQTERFTECVNSHRYGKEVLKDLHDGITLGIASTPTFFVNGRPLIGARPVADFQKLIDPLLKERPVS